MRFTDNERHRICEGIESLFNALLRDWPESAGKSGLSQPTQVTAPDVVAAPQQPSRRLYSIKEWIKRHPSMKEGGIRHLIFYGQQNGFDAVIKRVGRRVYIDEDDFFLWIEKENPKPSDLAKKSSIRRAV